MIDHVGFAVSDYERGKAFYERALAPLGYTLLMEFSRERLHVALAAETREQVDADNGAYVLDPDGHNVEAVCHAPS